MPAFLADEEPKAHVCVYPFVRSLEWYLLDDAERRRMLAEHGQMARGYPDVHVLVIRLQPNEGMTLTVMIKEPGPGGMRLTEVPLDMSFADALGDDHAEVPDAYERLITDVIRGNQTLFMRGDEVEAAWAWADPIIAAWENASAAPESYDPGTSGPDQALGLMHRDGRRWREIKA